jgi:hypothetical protein
VTGSLDKYLPFFCPVHVHQDRTVTYAHCIDTPMVTPDGEHLRITADGGVPLPAGHGWELFAAIPAPLDEGVPISAAWEDQIRDTPGIYCAALIEDDAAPSQQWAMLRAVDNPQCRPVQNRYHHGDRVRVNRPLVGGKLNPWHGRLGTIAAAPGDPLTAGGEVIGKRTSYTVILDDGSPYPTAPHDEEGLLAPNPAYPG